MFKTVLFIVVAALFASAAQAQSSAVELANLREDVRLLTQRVGELNLKTEQLERENVVLRASQGNTTGLVTVSQLNQAVVELRQEISAGDAATAERAATQIKKLGDATNVALETLAKGQAPRASAPAATPATTTGFSDSFPSEGISYTVQKGDTLAVIARKTGAKQADIINANKIADPSKIRLGDTLFIPTGK